MSQFSLPKSLKRSVWGKNSTEHSLLYIAILGMATTQAKSIQESSMLSLEIWRARMARLLQREHWSNLLHRYRRNLISVCRPRLLSTVSTSRANTTSTPATDASLTTNARTARSLSTEQVSHQLFSKASECVTDLGPRHTQYFCTQYCDKKDKKTLR